MYLFISLLSSFSLLYFLSTDTILTLFIVLGQAHFLIAYIYAHRASKINKRYIITFLTLFLSFGLFCSYIFLKEDVLLFKILIMSTLMFFVFHYFNDEYKISGFSNREVRKFGTQAVLFSFFALLLVTLFKTQATTPFIYFVFGVSFVYSLLFSLSFLKEKENKKGQIFFYIFFLANILVPLYITFFHNVHIHYIAGCIILFHYFRWYLRYLDIFKGSVLREYFGFVVWCNVFFVLLFVWYVLSFKSGLLIGFFNPCFFYGWTMIHIILSTKKEDVLL